jgi:hypothetical protein
MTSQVVMPWLLEERVDLRRLAGARREDAVRLDMVNLS